VFGLTGCTVYGRKDVKSGTAILTEKNSVGAQSGSKIILIVGDKEFHLAVWTLVVGDEDSKDHITVSTEDGLSGAVSGVYRLIPDSDYNRAKVVGTKKARAGLVYLVLSILSAAGASIAASQKDGCSGLGCVKGYTWLLMVVSACLAATSWYKDNLA
jgi:hypothetical protein